MTCSLMTPILASLRTTELGSAYLKEFWTSGEREAVEIAFHMRVSLRYELL